MWPYRHGRAEERLVFRLEAQAAFLGSHGPGRWPRLFNHLEVERLNASRPGHDQLELLPTGLSVGAQIGAP